MAKKKKEVCPYCGNSFAYLSRHKCKVKERLEGSEESDKTQVERRIERLEERKRHFTRSLKKDEWLKAKAHLAFELGKTITEINALPMSEIGTLLAYKIQANKELSNGN